MSGCSCRDIPVNQDSFSIIDQEFNNMHELFEDHMKKMHEEMVRFMSTAMECCEPLSLDSSSDSCCDDGCITEPSSAMAPRNTPTNNGLGFPCPHLNTVDFPSIIQEDAGEKKLKLRFDLSEYSQEEIAVKAEDNLIVIRAKKDKKTENKSTHKEFHYQFTLPEGVDPGAVSSSLSTDGVLTVEATFSITGMDNLAIAQNCTCEF